VFARHATTGDGLLTGLQLAVRLVQSGKSLSELAGVVHVYPQVLVNVREVNHESWQQSEAVLDAIRATESALANRGRVLVRASGTEAMVRVMVEAETEAEAESHSARIVAVIRRELSL
jgi:phosphoglucosamine mutase